MRIVHRTPNSGLVYCFVYYPDIESLDVCFRNATYRYPGISAELFKALLAVDSAGVAYNTLIKGKYSSFRLPEEERITIWQSIKAEEVSHEQG